MSGEHLQINRSGDQHRLVLSDEAARMLTEINDYLYYQEFSSAELLTLILNSAEFPFRGLFVDPNWAVTAAEAGSFMIPSRLSVKLAVDADEDGIRSTVKVRRMLCHEHLYTIVENQGPIWLRPRRW